MTAFLRLLLTLTISGTVLAGCVRMLTPLLSRRPALREALLLAAGVRMLFPAAPEWRLIAGLFPGGEGGLYETARRLAHFGAARVAAFLWFFGACAAFAPHLWGYIKLRRKIRQSIHAPSAAQQEALDTLCTGRRKPLLRCSAALPAPVTFGVLHPVIILPDSAGQAEQLAELLRLELVRIRRFDNLRGWLMLLAACVHWFNPAAWYLNRTARTARVAAREAAVRGGSDEAEIPGCGGRLRRAVRRLKLSW